MNGPIFIDPVLNLDNKESIVEKAQPILTILILTFLIFEAN